MDTFNALNPLVAMVASPYEVVAKRRTKWREKGRGERGLSLLGRIRHWLLLEKGESPGFLLMGLRASPAHGAALVPLSCLQQVTAQSLLSRGRDEAGGQRQAKHGGENEPAVPSLHGSALGVDVGNSRFLQETGNSGTIIASPWVVRNQGALQVAVPGSQSHGMQLPQEKHPAPAEPWRGAGQDRCEPSGTGLSHPLETPSSVRAAFLPGGAVSSDEIHRSDGLGEINKEGNVFEVYRKSTGRCAPGRLGMEKPVFLMSPLVSLFG